MAACSSCSVDLPDGARFCFSCGATQGTPTCAACAAQLVAGARFCMECGAAQAAGVVAPAPAHPAAARRVTSVLFGDLVGFTSLSETRDQEEVRELLTRYFDECRRVIARYGGTVEKFIGDAVMAVWGVPTAHEDDAERSVRAGLELVNVVASMGEELGVPDLAMRVGIVTGEVAVTIGAEQQGMVAGDAVNTAARVQSAATPGQVWVDETTRLLTSAAITYLDVGSHSLKGKADPVPLWSVRAVVAAVGGAQRADGLEAPLVGRERELRLVKELFHSVEDSGRPSLLVLVGEPGVGKSRLAWEFEKYVDGLSTPVRWHSGRCVAYGEGVAFYALAEAVRGRLSSLHPDDDVEDAVQLLEDGLTRYVGDPEERDWLRPRLGALLGIGSVGTFPREDLFSAWAAFLQRVGEDQHPVVLVIDDAQFADDGLLHFVEHLLNVAAFPCFVLLLTRPGLLEEHPSLATNRSAHVSHLTPLSSADTARLLDGLVSGLPDEVRDRLSTRSEGVPLFAVETVRSLIDKDLVVPRGGAYVLADPGTLDLDSIGAPASLHALIAARLDALSAAQRRLVERGSVLGTVFSRKQVSALCAVLGDVPADRSEEEVAKLLGDLVRLQILSQTSSRLSSEFGQYQFVQDVVRQVGYATLSRRDRRVTHLAVARQMESEGDEAGDLAPIIAQHYLDAIEAMPAEPDVADLEAAAIAHLERAAQRARSLGAMSESAGHLMVALARASDPAIKARLQSAAAWALTDWGESERAIPLAAAAAEAFDDLDDPISAGIAAAAQGTAFGQLGDNTKAMELVEPRYTALIDVPGAERALLLLSRTLITAEVRIGGQVRREVMNRQIQIAEKIGDRAELAACLSGLSLDFYWMGASHTGGVLMEASADLARKHHLPEALARCLNNLTVDYNLKNLAKAVELGREGVEVARRTGMGIWQTFTALNLALGLLAAGGWDEAESVLREAPTRSTMDRVTSPAIVGYLRAVRGEPFRVPWEEGEAPVTDDTAEQAWRSFCLAMQAHSRGDDAEALVRALEAVGLMNEATGLSDDLVHMWPMAADLAIGSADLAAVHGLLSLIDDAAARMLVPLGVQAHRQRVAGLLARSDDPDRAAQLLEEAIDMFGSWGARPFQARTEIELGQLLVGRNDVERGTGLVERGRAVLAQLGATTWLRDLDTAPVAG